MTTSLGDEVHYDSVGHRFRYTTQEITSTVLVPENSTTLPQLVHWTFDDYGGGNGDCQHKVLPGDPAYVLSKVESFGDVAVVCCH